VAPSNHEAAERSLDADDRLNAYGRELDALAEGLGLDDEEWREPYPEPYTLSPSPVFALT
jgi:hypothetical protein